MYNVFVLSWYELKLFLIKLFFKYLMLAFYVLIAHIKKIYTFC